MESGQDEVELELRWLAANKCEMQNNAAVPAKELVNLVVRPMTVGA